MIQYSQMMRKLQNTPHSVHHFCVIHYNLTQKYSAQGYILGRRQLELKINTNYITNMYRCIIYSWWGWLHCIVWTSGWYLLPLHHHRNFICRRPHYFVLEISNAFQNTIYPTLQKDSIGVYHNYTCNGTK